MKIKTRNKDFRASFAADGPPTGLAGFTLAETLICVGIFAMLVAWMISAQIYGMRVYTLTATKLVATAGARHAMDEIRDQIRGANEVDIGNCASGWASFSFVTNGAQQGNAVEIFPTTNSTPYLIYYLQTGGTNQLMLYNSDQSNAVPLASYITNQVLFDAEDLRGNILSNNVNNRIIRMTLQFSQWQYPIGRIGNTNLNSYDLYQLRMRATRRAID